MAGDIRTVRRRCAQLVSTLHLPNPITMIGLVAAVASRQRKQIELSTVSRPPASVCGLLVRTTTTDFILYDADASALHQLHTVAHEVGHLLLSHHGHQQALDVARVREVAPDLPLSVIRSVLGPPAPLTDRQEMEAEVFAGLIIAQAARQEIRTSAPSKSNDIHSPRHPLVSAFDLNSRHQPAPASMSAPIPAPNKPGTTVTPPTR